MENERKMIYEEQLQKLFANVNDWLKFAEAKNFGLLAINAAVVFGFTQSQIDNDNIRIPGLYILIPFMVASMLPCILSLFPIISEISLKDKGHWSKKTINILSGDGSRDIAPINIHFYGYLKDVELETFKTQFISRTTSSLTTDSNLEESNGEKQQNTQRSKVEPFTLYEEDLISQILYNSKITFLKYQMFKIAAKLFLLGSSLFIALSLLLMLLCDKVCMC